MADETKKADKKQPTKPKTPATSRGGRRKKPPELLAFEKCVTALSGLSIEDRAKCRRMIDVWFGPQSLEKQADKIEPF